MKDEGVDAGKRRFLTLATSVVGGAGAAAAAVPFLASFKPSARAKALGAPVKADVSKIEEGARITYTWRGSPVWVVKRNERMLGTLPKLTGELRDPQSEQPQQPEYVDAETRSIKPELLVMIGRCTHLGCSPLYRPDADAADVPGEWMGGFFCPCHGSKFDLAGRVYKGVPAPLNMEVPPHRYESDAVIIIGEDTEAA
ncbi:ubiquinol-cytochrome c reductase iron-sulfur subunit [uncultured Abyssibacter sp.]|uniref:ubiquinol-cytochrome c reductase iron-sulfur subunit n=1 Tax=uncultured Abyssibacter sp. TaxID=2320202 RepID=UPI0032B241E8